jgi:putative membrane protein
MAFGFVIERFGLFVHMLLPHPEQAQQRGISFWIGLCFIILGTSVIVASVGQYRRVLRTLRPVEIPRGYWVNMGVMTNLAVAVLAIVLILYLFSGPALGL